MKVDTSRIGLVRGYFIYADRDASLISESEALNEDNIHVGIAHTFWHRHDDDPTKVEQELESIARCYQRSGKCSSAMMGFEYRPYSK